MNAAPGGAAGVRRLIVAMTGASGQSIGVRILLALRDLGVETHLIMTRWAQAMVEWESEHTADDVRALAHHVHGPADMAALLSSGSYPMDGMIVAPCSMKTLAAIRHGQSDTLASRAADVTIKEQRKLVLVPREMPLSAVHLENMLDLARLGVVIAPPMPAFYHRPESVDEVLTHVVARVLDLFGLELPGARRWGGPPTREGSPAGEDAS
ncbi:UbiX family flavin prenyltransferase [Streptomyces sp. AV19]|uniref:UbiX family flavin prenyltransferase n=1 Tax=Streptomyces sp. AV19 TaxID=2793068 RepID=UPI0018FE4470|nr:UbiX family flavin prenyltransferase [Streptomyces sp. AV19]MBH1937578.1 UbiX family flavin prenyltransferase [Streptomyces sp. AV19]MDG4533593.1 UbiX family flavin prenyltransferase [Streptomyces sp. AV19]